MYQVGNIMRLIFNHITFYPKSILFVTTCLIGRILSCSPVSAQIRPDSTLPSNSIVKLEGSTSRISGGTQAGSNLFHSFQKFDLPKGNIAHFDQQSTVANIFARITSGQMSNLDGAIQTNGTANLFLINPAGILFGPNSQLKLGGSFLVTTANSLLFPDGKVFSANPRPQSTPILSINRPLGLAFSTQQGSITVRSQPGLNVQPSKTLSLIGGEVFVGGNLTAPNGRIEIGAVDSDQQVRFNFSNIRRETSYEKIQRFKDIRIDNLAIVDTSGIGGGDIDVYGNQVTLANGGRLQAFTFGNIDGGTITVNATDSLSLLGNLSRKSPIDPISVRIGFFLPQKTTIFSTTTGTGRGNNVEINADTLRITNGADISAVTDGLGNGGMLNINANQLIDIGGETIVFKILPEAVPFIEPNTRKVLIDQTSVSTISARSAFIPNSGASGNISIKTHNLKVKDGANITAGSISGPGGSISIEASGTVEIVGSTMSGFSTSNIVTSTISRNKGNDLRLNANKLILRDGGLITSSSFGQGQAGNIEVATTESLELLGVSRTGVVPSQVNSGSFSIGNSGNINIQTKYLKIKDGAAIQLNSLNRGQSGSLSLIAQNILLDNQGLINSNAVVSQAGNISVKTKRLILKNGSNITTNSLGNGTGGNIKINTDLLIALPLNGDSNIFANSITGAGGQIDINTKGIFGIEIRDRNTSLNDITAISEKNPQLNGVVRLITPEAEPTKNLTEQPEVVNSSPPIATGCHAGIQTNQSRFVNVGRGGLPTNPQNSLSELNLWQDLRVDRIEEKDNLVFVKKKPSHSTRIKTFPKKIIEAQGWTVDQHGKTILKSKHGYSNHTTQQHTPSC